jgi:4-hydroxybutyrate CoA-transferase
MRWPNVFREKMTDATSAVARIELGNRVYLGGDAGVPQSLVDALVARSGELQDVELVYMLHFGNAPYVQPEYAGSFRHNAVFIGHNVRSAVQAGLADFTPVFLSEIPRLFQRRILPLDVTVHPP